MRKFSTVKYLKVTKMIMGSLTQTQEHRHYDIGNDMVLKKSMPQKLTVLLLQWQMKNTQNECKH